MELKDYLRVLQRNWLLVIACALTSLLVAGAASLAIQPHYKSETQLFVALQNSQSVSELQQGNVFTQARVQSYVKTVGTPVVLQPVIDSLGLDTTPQALSDKVSAVSDANTVLISIMATDASPVQAAAIAQAVGDSLIRAVEELEKPSRGDVSPVKLSTITPAVAATTPSSPNVRLNLIVGLLVGVVLGFGAALLRSILDNKVRGLSDLTPMTDAPVLGAISYDSDATKKPLLTQAAFQSPRAESFRQLRTNLQFAHVSRKSKTLLMTSSLSGEGKSTTATNLAIALAQAGQSVALVDADLRRPMVAEYLGLERAAGLTTALLGAVDVMELLQPWGSDELFVLSSGQIPPNPSELLGSLQMKELIGTLEESFDVVIIDAPPLLPVTDAAVLAQQVGGVVLVVGTQKVRTNEVEKALAALELVDADLLGIVLNRLPIKGPDASAYSYYGEDRGRPSRHSGPEHVNIGRQEDQSDRAFEQLLRGDSPPPGRLGVRLGRDRSGR